MSELPPPAQKLQQLQFPPEAYTVITDPERSFLISAPPGTGKTELLALKAEYIFRSGSNVKPKLLTLSVKRHAAEDLRKRILSSIGEQYADAATSYTFDGFAKELLDRFGHLLPPEWRPTPDYEIDTELFAPGYLAEKLFMIAGQNFFMEDIETLSIDDFALHHMAGSPLNPEMIFDGTPANDVPLLVWQHCLRRRPSVLDFPMICALAELLLRSNPVIATALRNSVSQVFLDEFQDSDAIHYGLLKTAFPPGSLPLTAAGDQQQNIMRWAGAMYNIFPQFQLDYQAPKLELFINYRTGGMPLDIQGYIAGFLSDKHIYPAVIPARTDAGGQCRMLIFPDETSESRFIAREIFIMLQMHGCSPRDMVIAVSRDPEKFLPDLQLAARDCGLKIRNEQRLGKLLTEPAVKLLLDLWRSIFSGESVPEARKNILKYLSDPVGSYPAVPPVERLEKFSSELLRRSKSLVSIPEHIAFLIKESISFLDEARLKAFYSRYRQGKWLNICLEELATHFSAQALECAAIQESVLDFAGDDFIPLTTIQQCKAGEYKNVFLIGLDYQDMWADDADPFQELRQVYTAASRTIGNLYFTACRTRRQKNRQLNGIKQLCDILAPSWLIAEFIENPADQSF